MLYSYLKQFQEKFPQVGCCSFTRFAFTRYSISIHLGRPRLLLGPLERSLVLWKVDCLGGLVIGGVGVSVWGTRAGPRGSVQVGEQGGDGGQVAWGPDLEPRVLLLVPVPGVARHGPRITEHWVDLVS